MSGSQSKSWYRNWWGVILAILIWPVFLIWLLWSKSEKANGVKIAGTVGVGVLAIMSLVVLAAALPSTPQSKPTASVEPRVTPVTTKVQPKTQPKVSVPKPSTTPTKTTSTPAPAPTPTHTIVYQFSLMSGKMSSTDMQNVGISWHNPSNNQHTLPSDILAAIQQIAAGSYTQTFQVSKVNNSNLYVSVNNYSDPDASIACTILVDGSPVDNETAPTSGFADCAGDPTYSDSGH